MDTNERCQPCNGFGDRPSSYDTVPGAHPPEHRCFVCNGTCIAPTDEALLAAYQQTTGEPGDAEDDALLKEIERRGLDV